MKVVVLITSLLLHSLIAQADSPSDDPTQLYQVAQCPAIGEDYERMVAKLDTIKAAIKDTGNCKHVTLAVDTLQKLLDEDRQKAIDIVDKSSEAGLSKEDSEFIKKYAEGLTKKVASLSDLFLHSNQCFAEDAPDPLSSLSGIVGEASSLIGSVAGPWGAPIALAGNIIAGFLSGLNEVMNSRAGYDFSKRDQWMSYVQNLCTYHTYREQVESLLDPVGRLSQLRTLQAKLEAQIEVNKKLYKGLADLQKGEMFRTLYESATAAVQRVAKLDGYQLVLLDDREIKFEADLSPAQVGPVIQNKRILFAEDAIDITERVLTDMNNAFNAPAPKSGAAK